MTFIKSLLKPLLAQLRLLLHRLTHRILHQIILAMLLVSLLPLALVWYQNDAKKAQLYQNHLINLNSTLRYNVDLIVSHIEQQQTFIENIAHTPLVQNYFDPKFSKNQSYQQRLLEFGQSLAKTDQIYDWFIITLQGDVVHSAQQESDLHTNLIHGPHRESGLGLAFKRARERLNTELSPLRYYPPSDNYAAFMATPIYIHGKLSGVLAFQFTSTGLFSLVNSYNGLGKTGELVAGEYADNGDIVATIPLKYDSDAVTSQRQLNKGSDATGMIKAIKGQSGKGLIIDYRGVEALAAWTYVPQLKWGLVVKTDLSELQAPTQKQTQQLLWLTLAIGLLIVTFTALSARFITTPIQQLLNAIEDYAQGQYSRRVHIKSRNELHALGQAFNSMADKIDQQIHKLSTQTDFIQAQSHEIESINNTLLQSVAERTTELKQANAELTENLKIVDQHVMLVRTDPHGTIQYASEAFCKVLGLEKNNLLGENIVQIDLPKFLPLQAQTLLSALQQGDEWRGEVEHYNQAGHAIWLSVYIKAARNAHGQISGFTALADDMADQKRLEQLAITDPLTQLYNRHHLMEVLHAEQQRHQRYQQPFSIVMFDIDHFKQVNDQFGHAVGDQVLVEIAALMHHHSRQTDVSGRWGGEEFLWILPATELSAAARAAELLRLAIMQHTRAELPKITCSFGVAPYQTNLTLSLKAADDALYQAKRSGRNNVQTARIQLNLKPIPS